MDGIAVRTATVADAAAIAAVHVAAWESAYRGLVPDEQIDSRTLAVREQQWSDLLGSPGPGSRTLVAERDGAIEGFCTVATPSRDPDAGDRTAEIAAVYVDPAAWRRGAGSALIARALEDLRRAGWREATVWLLADNDRARAFYAAQGFVAGGDEQRRPDLREQRMRRKL